MQLEPDSVILRDPSGKHPIQVLEQNYRAFRGLIAFAQRGKDDRFPGATREQAGSRHRQNHPQRIHASQLHGDESEPFFPAELSVARAPRPRKAEGLSSFDERRNSERS